MSNLKNALELDMQRNIIAGSPAELQAAIRNAADLQIGRAHV